MQQRAVSATTPTTLGGSTRGVGHTLTGGVYGLIAAGSFAILAIGLARHPLGVFPVSAAILVYCIALAKWPWLWLFLVPAAVPILDLAPVTGAIYFTDSDLLILATLGMSYGSWAWRPDGSDSDLSRRMPIGSLAVRLLIALLCLSYIVSAARGFLPYQPFDEQLPGYYSRWNSLRIAKGFIFAVLLAPLMGRLFRLLGEAAVDRFVGGLIAGLVAVSVMVVYERWLFPGVLDFSTDYRATGPFWEMHVGGATLDGFLALTLPFALAMVGRSRKLGASFIALAVAGLSTYAVLVTFSRGLYAACALIVAIMTLAGLMRRFTTRKVTNAGLVFATIGLALLLCLIWLVFRSGGYRSLFSAVVLIGATYLAGATKGARGTRFWIAATGISLLCVAIDLVLCAMISKGAYAGFVLAILLFGAAWYVLYKTEEDQVRPVLLGTWIALAFNGAMVANHWGGAPAWRDFALLAAGLAVPLLSKLRWRPTIRGGVTITGVAAMSAFVLAVSAGYYMGVRFGEVHVDFQGRINHWHNGLAALDTPYDWMIGKGVGRFPEAFFWRTPGAAFPGTFSLAQEGGNRFLRLTAGRHVLGWGELFRLVQWVSIDPSAPPVVMLSVRTGVQSGLHIELCRRHLLYPEGCALANIAVAATGARWQEIRVTLEGKLGAGPHHVPEALAFGIAVGTGGQAVDLDNVQLLDASGQNRLRNSEFSDDGNFWFFTSDRHHLPWHIKNLFLNILFDQGILGLVAVLLLCIAVVARVLTRLRSWKHGISIVAAVCGFLVVGLFDSLLDAPRLGLLFFLLCFITLIVPAPQKRALLSVTDR